jgi:hypothetical protein
MNSVCEFTKHKNCLSLTSSYLLTTASFGIRERQFLSLPRGISNSFHGNFSFVDVGCGLFRNSYLIYQIHAKFRDLRNGGKGLCNNIL